MSINQAVLFTKPVHHLDTGMSPEKLNELTQDFFGEQGFEFVCSRSVTGSELAERDVIRQHYLMYSKAACADTVDITDGGKVKFREAFGKSWEDELSAGRILPTADLLQSRSLDVHQLFDHWNNLFVERKTVKLQDGILMGYLEEVDAYCINAFYPSMEANFYHPDTRIHYHVVEFDPAQVSWKSFRKNILGATDSSKADPASFRGRLYSQYPVRFPGRDNFVHGSAGPIEGFVERAIHEPDFNACSNPIGRYLAEREVSLDEFKAWKSRLSITEIGELFDATEEMNTDEVLPILDRLME